MTKKWLHVRLREELHTMLKVMAAKEKTSIQEIIEKIIEKALDSKNEM